MNVYKLPLTILGRRVAILTCNGPLKTPTRAILSFPSQSSVLNGYG